MPPAATPVSYESRLAEAITRRRVASDEIKPITAVMSLQLLLDAAFCMNVSQELAKGGRAWEVRRATPDLWTQIPDKPGLYMFVLTPNLRLKVAYPETETNLPRALYVGKAGSASGSGTLRARYRTEYKNYVSCDPDRLWDRPRPSTGSPYSRNISISGRFNIGILKSLNARQLAG
jgi:hypothetical protein